MKSTIFRKVLAFMVSAAMVFGLTPSYAFAESTTGETQSQEGETKVKAAGTIAWDDDNAAERPDSVTLHLRTKGSDVDIDSITVAAGEGNSWQYGFGNDSHEFPQYKDGVEIEYVVVEDVVEGYSTTVEGFDITNTRMRNAPDTAEVIGVVEWDDARNAKGLRPESIFVHLYANGVEERGPLEVTKGEYGLYLFSFGEVPVNDSNDEAITYSVVADAVPHYNIVNDLGPYAFRITCTLDVPEEQKELAEITSVPKPCAPTYNGKARVLIEAGSSPHGTMMYALVDSSGDGGDDADAPADEAFSTELPVATDAGTYTVWYYVKGDAFHKNNGPVRMEAEIGKRDVTFTGESATASYTGSEIAIEGVTVEGLLEGHTHAATFSAKGTDVGEHEGTFAFVDSDSLVIMSGDKNVTANYAPTFENGVLTIEQDPDRVLEITSFEGAKYTYDGEVHALAAATTNALSGETTIEYSRDGTAWTEDLASLTATDVADSCTIRVRASNPNYADPAEASADLAIGPAEATIKVDGASKVAGEPDPAFTGTVGGLVSEGDLGEVRYVRTGTDEAPGTYRGVLTAEYAENPNYGVSVENGDFTITEAPAEKAAPSPTPDPNDDKADKQKSGVSATSTKGTSSTSPKTGDTAGVVTLALGILALIALCTAIFVIIRRRANHE